MTLHKEKTGLMATIQNDNDVSVSLRMFDAQAVSFHIHLARFKGAPRVVVTTGIDPKIVGGNLSCSTYDG